MLTCGQVDLRIKPTILRLIVTLFSSPTSGGRQQIIGRLINTENNHLATALLLTLDVCWLI